ncbi:hypothetical protein [Campylobacter hyointestinalis]|uniref:Phage anti-repressor protein n=1 Tax=Campylobacter hyointestinalis subsp. hyointestinalis TaxID=91352 RepID=A0A9W5AN91_CAMHY|nr:hypothetical protein [Campylobacter hyointestinalis]CUU74221.1 putative phage anti-repressor protein [Campylobacter hyointestinalis subsp. hyointestinalis]CUU82021.1 putative phage anti-repressor protein [Campylobacter hyointestinalis subsp. hyointestinalis]
MLQLFQTYAFSSSQVAVNYGVSSDTIRSHLDNHNDEFIENIHYFYTINPKFKTKIINLTLEGVYMLGFFIKSHKAKEYRKQVALLLKEQSEAKFKDYQNKLSNLEAIQISQAKHHQSVVSGYKSQLVKHNEQIKLLKAKLTIAEDESLGYDDDIYFKYNALLDTLNKLKFGFSELYLDIFKEDMSRRDAFIQKARVSHYA